MDAEIGFWEWAFKGIVGIVIAGAAWLWTGLVGDFRSMEKDQRALERSHNEFRLEAERTFVKEVSLQATLERLHLRIDDMSSDIKTLISKVH